jgi:hypothetical protein
MENNLVLPHERNVENIRSRRWSGYNNTLGDGINPEHESCLHQTKVSMKKKEISPGVST